MRIEELVGSRVAAARDLAGMTQTELGGLLGKILGKPWSRQAVSNAEKGRRAFTAGDLVALAIALDLTVDRLLVPPAEVEFVELADGQKVQAWELTNPVGHAGAFPSWAALIRDAKASLHDARLAVERSSRDVDELNVAVARQERYLMQAHDPPGGES